MYQPQFLNSKFLPTTDEILQAMRSANQPDPSKRDCRLLQSIIAAVVKTDLDVLSAVGTRVQDVLGFEFTFNAVIPKGATEAPGIEVTRAAEIEARFRRSNLHLHFGTLMGARFNGRVALQLNQWSTAGPQGHYVMDCEPVDAINLKRTPGSGRGVSRIVYPTYDEQTMHQLVPYETLESAIIAESNPLQGFDSEFEGGLIRPMIYLTVLKHFNWYDWALVGERYGDPAKIAKYPRSLAVKQSEVDNVWNFITTLATESAAAIPDDIKIDFLDLVSKGASADMFDKFIEKVTARQTMMILGQNVVNSAHEVGTFAQAKEANKTTQSLVWSDLLWLEELISTQYCIADYTLNYGTPSTGIYPRLSFVTNEIEDYRQNAAIVNTLTGAGYDLDDAEVSRRTGFTVRKSPTPTINI